MIRIFYLLLISVLFIACDSFKEKAGLVKYQPDEYQVVTNPPLTLPPDFNVKSPEELVAQKNQLEETNGGHLSQGENNLLNNMKQAR
jgi:hypothetical protein